MSELGADKFQLENHQLQGEKHHPSRTEADPPPYGGAGLESWEDLGKIRAEKDAKARKSAVVYR
jgi:hypothetical protein